MGFFGIAKDNLGSLIKKAVGRVTGRTTPDGGGRLIDLHRLAKGGFAASVEKALKKAGREDVSQARKDAPKNTGALRASIGFASNRLGYYLYASAPYAHYVLQRVPFMPTKAETIHRLERELERAWS